MKNRICGKFPEVCYKAFKCEEHAKQFVDCGAFRMGCIRSYRKSEDEWRCDPTEGEGHTKEPGIVTAGWVSPNPAEKTIWTREPGYQEHHVEYGNGIFLLCTCLAEVSPEHMEDNFGKYRVGINNPRQLAEDISAYFISKRQKVMIVGCKVVYNKGQKLEKELSANDRLDMSYKQKPERFIPDCEFRIVAIRFDEECKFDECKFLGGQSEKGKLECEFIEVNLGRRLDYLSFVTL